jgi:hypothetical protein
MSKGPWKETAGREIMAKLESKAVDGDKVCLTIKRCFVQRIGTQVELVVEFREFEKKGMRCNKTQAAALQALVGHGSLPDNFNEVTEEFAWDGLALPLFKKKVEYTDRETGEVTEHIKLYPVSPALYDKAVLEYPRLSKEPPKSGRARAAAAKTATKGRGK